MQQEYKALIQQKTWYLVSLPFNKKALVINGYLESYKMLMALLINIKLTW